MAVFCRIKFICCKDYVEYDLNAIVYFANKPTVLKVLNVEIEISVKNKSIFL